MARLAHDTFQRENNKGADQTARICRLVCTFVVPCNKIKFSRIEDPNKITNNLDTPQCMLGNFTLFVVCWFFSKLTFSKNSFSSTINESNSSGFRSGLIFCPPDLGPNCLQSLLADDKCRHLQGRSKSITNTMQLTTKFCYFFKITKQGLVFHVNNLLTENSNKMSNLTFLKNEVVTKLSSAAVEIGALGANAWIISKYLFFFQLTIFLVLMQCVRMWLHSAT